MSFLKINKDEHVYCTDCIYGNELIDRIMTCYEITPLSGSIIILNRPKIPEICKSCWPYDWPDSRSFEMRHNYVEKNKKRSNYDM